MEVSIKQYGINYFLKASLLVFASALLVSLFMLFQQSVILYYNHSFIKNIDPGLIRFAFILGFRFSLKIMLLSFIPAYLIAILIAPVVSNTKRLQKFLVYYLVVISILYTLISVINYFYFQAFGNGFDHMLFLGSHGSLSDTMAMVKTIYQDYPVISGVLVLVLVSYTLTISIVKMDSIVNRIHVNIENKTSKIAIITLVFLAYIVIMRGASLFSTFPLRYGTSQFSKSHVLNASTINAPMALFYAYKSYVNEAKINVVSLSKGHKFYEKWVGQHQQKFGFNTLFTKTPHHEYLIKHPPNVVFVQMESMGNHFLQKTSKNRNQLLGKLAKYYEQDFVFRDFLSGGNDTQSSLAQLTTNATGRRVLRFPFNQAHLFTFIGKPFKQAGYKTIFIKAGTLGWGNFGPFFRHQGFDDVIGTTIINHQYPQAKTNSWGVYDGYAFLYAQQLLKKADKAHQPVFIYIVTSTNHPPYSIPSDYQPFPINKETVKYFSDFMKISQRKTRNIFLSFQYANNALGQFIKDTSKQPWGERTIIAASGDHNQHEMLPRYSDSALFFLHHSVPFFIHIPKAYRPKHVIDTKQVGSHKDIFPTLFHLALSDARILNSGADLLALHPHSQFGFGINSKTILLYDGIMRVGEANLFYPFKSSNSVYLGPARHSTLQQRKAYEHVMMYKKLMKWQIDWQETCLNPFIKHPKSCHLKTSA